MSNSEDENYDDLDDYLDEMGDALLSNISEAKEGEPDSSVMDSEQKEEDHAESVNKGGNGVQENNFDELDEEQLQKQIDEQMQNLFGDMYTKDEKSQDALKELMMKLADEYEGDDDDIDGNQEKDGGPKDIISGTLKRLKKQDEKVQKDMDEAKERNEFEEMMKQFLSLGLDKNLESLLSNFGENDIEGEDGNGVTDNMLKDMLKDFISKEMLYEPMKQMETDMVDFIAKNKETWSPEELEKAHTQQEINKKIIALFEDPSYDDANEATRQQLSEYLDQMQELGLSELGEGFPNLALNNMPSLDADLKGMNDECVHQ